MGASTTTIPLPFLTEPRLSEPAMVALFGKHPTSADHLEDIGLSSPSLAAFKQGFYIDGIGDCLTRQMWAKDLGVADSIPYNHSLLCVGVNGWLAARFEHSSDAPGRKQFPLVLAMHCCDFNALNRIAEIGQVLDAQIAAAGAAKEPAVLRQVHALAQSQSQELVKTSSTASPPGQVGRQGWLQGLSFNSEHPGLWRTYHALSPRGAGAGRARVPLHTGGLWQSATLWLSLVRHLLPGPPTLMTITWKQFQPFADLTLAPPGARALSTLFASDSSQPLTAAVPFNVAPELKAEAQAAVQQWVQSPVLFPDDSTVKASLLNKVCNGVRGWFKATA